MAETLLTPSSIKLFGRVITSLKFTNDTTMFGGNYFLQRQLVASTSFDIIGVTTANGLTITGIAPAARGGPGFPNLTVGMAISEPGGPHRAGDRYHECKCGRSFDWHLPGSACGCGWRPYDCIDLAQFRQNLRVQLRGRTLSTGQTPTLSCSWARDSRRHLEYKFDVGSGGGRGEGVGFLR
jgi:hypothetical protein